MPDRSRLHELVDSLPERVLIQAERVLRRYQAPPKELQRSAGWRREQVLRKRQEIVERLRQRGGQSGGFGGGGSGGFGGDVGAGSRGWEDENTFAIVAWRLFAGHEFEIQERLRRAVDGSQIIYEHKVVGPGGKTEQHTAVFPVG